MPDAFSAWSLAWSNQVTNTPELFSVVGSELPTAAIPRVHVLKLDAEHRRLHCVQAAVAALQLMV
eukprot:9604773-Karenia_brevis.AAC.1